MKVMLMVNWEDREILTTKELDERINARIDEVMQDTDAYDEFLDDYLDANYTRMELFNALIGGIDEIEQTVNDIRAGVAEGISDWVDMNISGDFYKVIVEV